MGVSLSRGSEKQRTEVGPATAAEIGYAGEVPLDIASLRQLGGRASEYINQLIAEDLRAGLERLPGAHTIGGYLTGTAPGLAGMAKEYAGREIDLARGQIQDYVSAMLGRSSAAAGAAGMPGGSQLGAQRLYGTEAGARQLAEAVQRANMTWNPLAMGTQIGTNLLAMRTGLEGSRISNRQLLGNLFGITGQLFGGASDIMARELGQLRQFRLGTATRYGQTSSMGASARFGGSGGGSGVGGDLASSMIGTLPGLS